MENEILEETVINNTEEEFIEDKFEIIDIQEIKTKQVVITSKFNCQSFPLGRYEKTTFINEDGIEETKEVFIPLPHLIEITEEELAQIDPKNGTKCFDLENDCVIDYDNNEYLKQETIKELRAKRQSICFPIINRGQFWYDTLSKSQKEELKVWYNAWLDVTETMEEPKVPDFLSEELEKFYIFAEEKIEEEFAETLDEEIEKENELFEIEEDIENIRDNLDEEMLLEEEV